MSFTDCIKVGLKRSMARIADDTRTPLVGCSQEPRGRAGTLFDKFSAGTNSALKVSPIPHSGLTDPNLDLSDFDC